MIFNSKKVAFGRHETFALRYSWLTKGFQELMNNSKIFTDDNATVKLGVGKNMVNSIRYWLHAAQIAQPTKNGYQATEIGKSIFDAENGFDPYLEDEATIWLIHWLLASNPTIATSWYWFFNYFHKAEFTNKEVTDSLHEFAKERIESKFTLGTLKKDVDIILRMYSSAKAGKNQSLEEVLDSPLSILKLISHLPNSKSFYSAPEDRNKIPLGIIGFAVTSIFKQAKIKTIPIENLMYKRANHPALGAIFRMTENSLLTKLELLLQYIPNCLAINETAGINQLHLMKDIEPITYLNKHYANVSELEVAA